VTVSTADGDGDKEYRVVRRPRGREDAEWKLVITSRGLGRPFNSPAAAKGLITREQRDEWNHGFEYKVQWRPVTTEWNDL
jgi:hypothetical protein